MTTSPIYLLHGLLETAKGHFAPQIRAWSKERRVIPVDLPGHGACPVDVGDRCVEVGADYVLALLEKFGAGHLIGASYLGGPVAVHCAVRRPDLVRSLVLTGLVPDVEREVFARWVEAIVTVAGDSEEMAAAYDRVHGPRWRRTLSAYSADVDLRYGTAVQVTSRTLARLRRPVLIANGSKKSAERQAALTADHIATGVRGAVIENAGHIPGKERPEQFEAVVTAFWRETEGDREVV